jgi:6-phosphogluconolactonase
VIEREVIVCRDAAELSRKAAEQFIALAGEASSRFGRFAVALSGGSTPKALYSLLASPEYKTRLDWDRVHLFWGDERCVSPDHQDSNYRMVREALLGKIDLPDGNIHRMAGERDPAAAAIDYENELRAFFQSMGNATPRFDLILLGIGEDGHTASLFPGSTALNEQERLVATTYVERLKGHRLTLTLPVINAAAQVTFLVAGQSKATIIKEILGKGPFRGNYPAAHVAPSSGRLAWLVTADAAPAI